MSVVNFLDSNVIIYLFDSTDETKRTRAEMMIEEGIRQGTALISYQVVQETLNVMLRKVNMRREEIDTLFNDVLAPLWTVNPSRAFYRRGLDIQTRYHFSFYDSLIIAAALEAGCKTLYSEDMQHGQKIQNLVIQNPFL